MSVNNCKTLSEISIFAKINMRKFMLSFRKKNEFFIDIYSIEN